MAIRFLFFSEFNYSPIVFRNSIMIGMLYAPGNVIHELHTDVWTSVYSGHSEMEM
jgi:hypothetical protein